MTRAENCEAALTTSSESMATVSEPRPALPRTDHDLKPNAWAAGRLPSERDTTMEQQAAATTAPDIGDARSAERSAGYVGVSQTMLLEEVVAVE